MYLRPGTIDEAVAALAAERLTILAGGTDFYPARVGKPLDDDILDISRIEALHGIAERDDHYHIGALTTWSEVIEHSLPPWFDGLKRAAREVGGVQIQNTGTVAGNICNASPAADGVPVLITLDAVVALASAGGNRSVALEDFITGNRETVQRADEMVTAIRVPKRAGPAAATFLKLGGRRYLVISIVMVSALIETADDGTVAAARIAVGACAPVARRLRELETALVGRALSPALAEVATAAHLAGLTPIDDVRGTASYRLDAALTLVRRALAELGGGPPAQP
jgi:CO/xanthine dehydrogenase FAD-binding subunit